MMKKNTFLLLFLIFVSACAMHKNNGIKGLHYLHFQDSTNYVHFDIKGDLVEVDWQDRIIGVMDSECDTLPKFRIILPTFNSCTLSGREIYFFYSKRRAIIIHRGNYDDLPFKFQEQERCDSLDYLSPDTFFSDSHCSKLMRKIVPDNDKYNYNCLHSGGTRIYIYNFKDDETRKIKKLIRNSLEYIPFYQ